MSYELEIGLIVKYETPEEAQLILNSVYSGYAAEVVRLSALYGQVPYMGAGVFVPPASSGSPAREREEQSIELVRVEDKVTKTAAPKEKPKKPAGLAGRKRMGRG